MSMDRGRVLSTEQQRVLRAVAGQTLLALQAQQLAADAADARRRAEMTELRSALLSAVGHDLRTPLTAIKAAVGCLRDPDLHLSPAHSETASPSTTTATRTSTPACRCR